MESSAGIEIRQSSIQYGGAMGQRNYCPVIWSTNVFFDRLGIIQWDSGSVPLTFQLFITKFHFFTRFLAKFLAILFFYYFVIYLTTSKKVISNSLLTVWSALRPSQQPNVSPNYSQSIKINIGPSDGGMIVPSTHRPTVLY